MNTTSTTGSYGNKINFTYYDENFQILKTNPHNQYKKLFEIHLKFYSDYYYIINHNIIKTLFKIAQYKEKELKEHETAICITGILNDKKHIAFSIQ